MEKILQLEIVPETKPFCSGRKINKITVARDIAVICYIPMMQTAHTNIIGQ